MLRRNILLAIGCILLLAVGLHIGSSNAAAQFGSALWGFSSGGALGSGSAGLYVMTPNGDVYYKDPNNMSLGPVMIGNFWSGGPTPNIRDSWGGVKQRFR